ncbi:MAG TPA: imidazole glycerol phosphate synthase subunit HisH [Deltaproteobacteria bacterium]|nr:imidazole glycerol phosphate synthase subunit HisH [Deltaproteobacteria bacterium]
MAVLIIDYGMGNLSSVKRAFEECGADAFISEKPEDLKSATHVILPGVGAFRDGIANLTERGWIPEIKEAVLNDGIPFLGICLGMQLLADSGVEGGDSQGLGLIPGDVRLLEPDSIEVRVPHVGWNEIHKTRQHALLEGIPDGTDFYFVHSYHLVPTKSDYIMATTPYCGTFVSAVVLDNVFGVQFHPEKSSRPGFQLISNFLKIKG